MSTISVSKFISVDTTLFSPKSSTINPCFFPKFPPNSKPRKSLTLVFSSSSGAELSSAAEDEWLKKLPEKKKPLYSHSLPCVEAWLRNLGFFQSKEDRAIWFVEKPEWHAQLSLDVTDLYIRFLVVLWYGFGLFHWIDSWYWSCYSWIWKFLNNLTKFCKTFFKLDFWIICLLLVHPYIYSLDIIN